MGHGAIGLVEGSVGGEAAAAVRNRREERAVAVFGTWMIAGLFLDGWAHGARKPETFFSPWHRILYSGFVAAIVWLTIDGRRHPVDRSVVPVAERITAIGLATFVIGAIGDGLWHQIFGIEVNVEALISPSHLALFIGGFLMVTGPIRSAAGDASEPSPAWGSFWPQAVTLTLAASLVAFFTQYLSAFDGIAIWPYAPRFEHVVVVGLGSIMATNLFLIAPVVYVVRRWRPPFGVATMLFTGLSVLMCGLDGFHKVALVVPAIVAGLVVDELTRRAVHAVWIAAAGSSAMWSGFFLTTKIAFGLGWSVELWAGSVVLATAAAALYAALTAPPVAQPPSTLR